jgi:hypothetical protein
MMRNVFINGTLQKEAPGIEVVYMPRRALVADDDPLTLELIAPLDA